MSPVLFLFEVSLPKDSSSLLLVPFNSHLSVQFSHSDMSDSLSPHGLQHTRFPCPITNFWSLLKLMSIELVMPSNHLLLCRPLLLLPSVFPSIRVFSSESALHIWWPKYWSFTSLLLLLLNHFSRVQLCATPKTAAHQAPLSLGFSRQEHWSGLPLPSPMHGSAK